MATLQSKISEAKKAGYSDEEIVKYVSSLPGFESKTQKAISQGYKPSEIVSFLASQSDVKPSAKAEPSDIGQKFFRTSSELPFQIPAQTPATFEEQATPVTTQMGRFAGGMLAGAATIPETIAGAVGPLKYKGVPLPVDIQPGRTLEAVRGLTGAGPEDKAIGLGKAVSEIAGTAGLGPLLGMGTKGVAGAEALSSYPGVQKALNALAQSLETSGFADPEVKNALGRIATKVTGGAVTGGATSALIGTPVEEGAGFGATLPMVGKAVGYTVNKARNIINPQQVALLDATGGKINDLIARLRSGEIIVPGTQPHAGEVAAIEQSANFSRLVADLLSENPSALKKAEVNDKIAEQLVQNAVARARQLEQAFGANQIGLPVVQGGEDALLASRAGAGNLLGQEQQTINERIAAQLEEANRVKAQEMAALQAKRREFKTGQQTAAEQLQAQQAQQLADLQAQQQAAKTAALTRREQMVNRLAQRQESARNALAAPIQPPAPPAELGALEQQRAALEAARSKVGAELPKVSQMEAGEPFIEKADVLAKQAQKEVVDPAYKEAFASHKGKIDMTKFADDARSEAPLESLDLSAFPDLRNKIKNHEKAVKQYELMVKAGEKDAVPPKLKLSLEEVNDLGKAINFELDDLSRSTAGASNVTKGNLKFIRSNLESVIDKNVSPETKQLLENARELAKTTKIVPYNLGIGGLMRQKTSLGRPGLLAEDVAKEVLNTEQAATEFVRAFGKDADSVDNLNVAIQDLYRRKVVQPKGVFDKAAHKKFMDDYGDQLNILDNAGFGIRDALEEQAHTAFRLESELGKVTGKIEGINKVQQDQLNMLKTQQEQAMKALEKSQKRTLGRFKERQGAKFSDLTDAQKAEYGATREKQVAQFNKLKKEQELAREEAGQRFAEEEAKITQKHKMQRQFLEQQKKEMSSKAHAKYASILKYKNVEEMRKAMLADPARFKETLPFLNKEARQRLAHDVVNDIVAKGGDLEKAFSDNAKNLSLILDETYPGDGKQIVDTLINKGRALNSIIEASNEKILRPHQPLVMREKQAIKDAVEQRRKDFTPEQLSDINALFRDYDRFRTFEDLAKEGSSIINRAATKTLEENTGSKSLLFQSLEKVTSWINQTTKRLAFIDDEKIRNRMALAALNPKLMAKMLEDAKKWQETGKKIGGYYKKAGSATSKAMPMFLESENRNALNQ